MSLERQETREMYPWSRETPRLRLRVLSLVSFLSSPDEFYPSEAIGGFILLDILLFSHEFRELH